MSKRLAALWITLSTGIFYWKILLTHQYSLLLSEEAANQTYAWFQYWLATLRQGAYPLWDPFTFSGRPFAGEMQTGAFYPLYLLLALLPFNRHGLFSPELYHVLYAVTHILGAFLMYLFVRELGVSSFGSLVSGICFSLGGFVARLGPWPHLLESSIWLPLILMFVVRGLATQHAKSAIKYSVFAGLVLAVSILAGGLHVAMMQSLALLSITLLHALVHPNKRARRRAILITATAGTFAFAGGAVQLFTSVEYSARAIRFIPSGVVPAGARIPYASLSDSILPHSFIQFVFSAFPASLGFVEHINPYLGVFPVCIAIIAIWRCWERYWVRYFTGFTIFAFLYSLGSFSLLHGILYAIVPWLWLAREAGRFLYLAAFGLAVLAGFGIDTVLEAVSDGSWVPLRKLIRYVVAACAVGLGYLAFIGKGDLSAWTSYSVLVVLLSCWLLYCLVSGPQLRWAKPLIVSIILFDLYPFDWNMANVAQEDAKHTNKLQQLLESRGLADFLRSRKGIFRVQFLIDRPPNIGDTFGVQTTLGSGVTMLKDYANFRNHIDLLNVWYSVRPASAGEPNAVYHDSQWKVYEEPRSFPRAWLVHHVIIEPDREKQLVALGLPSIDPHHVAVIAAPLNESVEPAVPDLSEGVEIGEYHTNQITLRTKAMSRALLVLSELDYPGWKAKVNGVPTPILNVDYALRGIPLPAGDTEIVVQYVPATFVWGAAITVVAFTIGGTLVLASLTRHIRAIA
jgi:hypothetical protein